MKQRGDKMEFILGIIILALDIWAIVNIFQAHGASTGQRLLWILLILILPVIGLIIWWLTGPRFPQKKIGITGSSRIRPSSCNKTAAGKNRYDNRVGRLITCSMSHRMILPARRLVCRHNLWQGRVTQRRLLRP